MRQTPNFLGFTHSQAYVKALTCLVLACGGASPIFAASETVSTPSTEAVQQNTVTVKGVVKDANGDPIIGASVIEKGNAKNGTVTDIDGNYSLSVKRGATLVVSYIGYVTSEAKGGNITLQEDLKSLNEVVVIGYGTQKKGDVTSAVASIKAEDFTAGKIGDAAELVKGKIAGLSVTNSSGDPTAQSSIMLRGAATLLGSVTPLILVDGVEGSLTTVAPENIASIDVLKDASAAAIYGTRGANGVILITTKTGKREQHSSITYSGYASFSNWVKKPDLMDTHDVIYGRTNFTNDGYDTDWLAAVTRKAGFKHNHSLTLEGGSATNTYSANVTYSDEDGIMRKSDNRNIKGQMDFTQYAFNDILKVNVNLLYSRQTYTNNNNAYVFRQAIIRNPSSPIYNEDGSYNEDFNKLYYYNPVEIQNELIGDTRNRFSRITGNVTLEPIKGWQTNLMMSMKENNSESETYYTSKYYSQRVANCHGWASKSTGNSRQDNIEITSQYRNNFGKHRLQALVGYSYIYNVADGYSAGNGNFPNETYLYNNLGMGTYLTDEDHNASMASNKSDSKLVGFFGRVSYGYDDRYNVMLSMRREGSSKFGANHKWGSFPSASAGWTISNEKFMESTKSWLSNLKLRVGYGVTGVIPNDAYKSLNRYNYDTYGWHVTENGQWAQSLKVVQNPNPNLKWETTREWNFGLDWSVLNDRLSGTVDVYSRTTKDLLFEYNVPVPPNLYNQTTANVASIRNTGIEVMVNAVPVKTKDFSWETTVTLSHNKNKLLNLSNDLYTTDNFKEEGGLGEPITVATHCLEVGHSLGDFWGLKSVGVNKDGVMLVEVSDGNGGWKVKAWDTSCNEQSNRQRLGTGTPKLYFGWNHTLRYKGFDLNMQFTGQFGYKILNAWRCFYENNGNAYNHLKSAAKLYPAINEDGTPYIDPETGEQKMVALSTSMQQGFFSNHLEKGDFLKLSSLTLGYTFAFNDNVKKYIKSARVYLSATNVFCLTSYSGIDPEVDNYYMYPGIDYQDRYPTTRSFSVGCIFNF